MSIDRFQGQIPHHIDTNLLERCQEQLRDYDLNYAGWTEPKNHTISYLAAAYLELAKAYEGRMSFDKETQDFVESVFEAQMETISQDD